MGEAGIATRVLSPYSAPRSRSALRRRPRDGARADRGPRPRRGLRGRAAAPRAPRLRPPRRPRVALVFAGPPQRELRGPARTRSTCRSRCSPSHGVPALVAGLDALGLPLGAASVTIPFKEEAAISPRRRKAVQHARAVSGPGARRDSLREHGPDRVRQVVPEASERNPGAGPGPRCGRHGSGGGGSSS